LIHKPLFAATVAISSVSNIVDNTIFCCSCSYSFPWNVYNYVIAIRS